VMGECSLSRDHQCCLFMRTSLPVSRSTGLVSDKSSGAGREVVGVISIGDGSGSEWNFVNVGSGGGDVVVRAGIV
jgi:hypothetical protein